MAEPARSLEAFTADLSREAQALGITPQNFLQAARDPQVSWRASMLPLVNYDDGTGGFGWPQMAVDAKNALGRFGRSVGAAMGEPWSPDETFPRPEDAVLPGLAAAGAGLGHLGLRGRSATSVAGTQRAAAPSGLPSHSVEAGSVRPQRLPEPMSARAYHGTGGPLEGGKFDLARSKDRLGIHFGTEDQAKNFARTASDDPSDLGTVYPADLQFRNAIDIPDQFVWAPGNVASAIAGEYPQFSGIIEHVQRAGGEFGPNTAARSNAQREAVRQYLLDQGVDGLRYPNQVSVEGPGTSYVAMGQGTVKSPSGETLFSNAPDAAPVGALAMDAASRMERAKALGFDTDRTLHHGTRLPFKEIDTEIGSPSFYATSDMDTAKWFAREATNRKGDGHVMDVYARGPIATQADVDRARGNIHALQRMGFTGREGMRRGEVEIFDPKNVRRTDAAFDPAKSDSANLLAANHPSASPLGLLPVEGEGGEEEFKADLRRQAIELGLIEGSPLEGVRVNQVDNYLKAVQGDSTGGYLNKRQQEKVPPPTVEKYEFTPDMEDKIAKELFGRAEALAKKEGISPQQAQERVQRDPEYLKIWDEIMRGKR